MTRRFFEDFEQRVCRVAVHRIGAVDHDDAPAALRRRQMKEGADFANVVDDDFAAQTLAARVEGTLHGEQVRMTAGSYAAEGAALRRHGEARLHGSAEHVEPGTLTRTRQHEAREAKCQRRLA